MEPRTSNQITTETTTADRAMGWVRLSEIATNTKDLAKNDYKAWDKKMIESVKRRTTHKSS